ncbi:MAG: NAD-dependent malic enzyme [Nitrospirae bacterium]|nr:MAG: NAD-dependent malic enzyme [Nitrospirota bacterium]
MAVRLELIQQPGMFARVASLIAQEGASLGAVDLVSATKTKVIRDITFDATSEAHAQRIVEQLNALPGVKVLSASDRIFLMHLGGKIQVASKFQIKTRNTLSMAYTPGVGRVAQAIAQHREQVYRFTCKSNSVAVVTDGSAVLGLGNLGPEAALPVMEGKVMLFQQFAGIDAWPICLSTQDPEEIIRVVTAISPGFGGINLEDISAPRCFEIERRLQAALDIPVMHDDQHGTAVVVLAALLNALKVTNRQLEDVKILVNGLGAAGIACSQLLLAAGVTSLKGCDKKGLVLDEDIEVLREHRDHLLSLIHYDQPRGSLTDALKGVDVFIGLSTGNVLKPEDLQLMAPDPIVFALANPDPEIAPELALPYCRIYASGRSDYPNQSNNLLAFPGMFRGALDVQARTINETMQLAAAHALAHVIPESSLSEEYIIPSVFDRRVVTRVAKAVAQAAQKTGVARRVPKHESLEEE